MFAHTALLARARGSDASDAACVPAPRSENQCWVIAAAQTGKHNPNVQTAPGQALRESYGHACIIDPFAHAAPAAAAAAAAAAERAARRSYCTRTRTVAQVGRRCGG